MSPRALFAQLRRVLRPPRVTAITRRPAGYFAVERSGVVREVIAWALYDTGQVIGLAAKGGGLRPTAGWSFRGYLAAAPLTNELQESAPAVAFPAADLTAAIGDEPDPFAPEAINRIHDRLRAAVDAEWAAAALIAFIKDPQVFIQRHLEIMSEHGRPAVLDAEWRAGLASITNPPAPAGIEEEDYS